MLIGFTTSDGSKHLGYRLSSANLGENWKLGPSVHGYYYFDEDPNQRNPISDVQEVFRVDGVDFFYWDSETNDFKLLTAPEEYKDDPLRILSAEYREWLIKGTKSSEMALYRKIREWLLLNAKCTKPVYIDKQFIIRSEGTIDINPEELDRVPDYIHFEK